MPSDLPITAFLTHKRPLRSLEFFPPKDDAGAASLRATMEVLRRIAPDFVSVTCGAGGGARERTGQVSDMLRADFGFTVMPHVTCVGRARAELEALAGQIHAGGFRNIMALRGDPPRGQAAFQPAPGGLRYASELVALLKARHADFCIGVAGYPEKHPEAPTLEADLDNLKRKVDAGATFVTTQLFFDNAHYYRFVEKCRARGIVAPIIPGIMPVLSLRQVQRITMMSAAQLPWTLLKRLEAGGDDADTLEAVGIDWALAQIRDLLAQGAPGYHLYILNRARSALALAAGLAA